MSKQMGVKAKKSEDFSEWYADVIQKAELIEHSRVSGCMVLRPHGYALWEAVQQFLDAELKQMGVENAYFPLLIPESLLQKEADHIEGFAPEVAWVTHTGDSELSERLAIRPTSETIMYDSYGKWIQSYRDLPLKLNQWCNVVRWEFNHPQPFLRTREFLWQEGHTAFATAEDAAQEVQDIIELYARAFEEVFAVPVFIGKKSEKEKFAGADYTLSIETFFPNGKAIQAATSHFLGQNFSKPFEIAFMDENEQKQYVFQNSWGFTTRSIGVMIGMHGDDNGLVLPPRASRIKAVIVPITIKKKPEASEQVMKAANALAKEFGWHLDDRDKSPGFKFNEWELKGIPVRIELGPRDLESNTCVVARRDTGEKASVPLNEVGGFVNQLLDQIQLDMLSRAREWLEAQVVDVSSLDELKQVVEQGKIGRAFWCGCDEQAIRDATDGAKSLNGVEAEGTCFVSGKPASMQFMFAKSY